MTLAPETGTARNLINVVSVVMYTVLNMHLAKIIFEMCLGLLNWSDKTLDTYFKPYWLQMGKVCSVDKVLHLQITIYTNKNLIVLGRYL